MTRAWLIARRELLAYVRSPMGASVIAGALLIDGLLFYWRGLSEKLLSAEVLAEFFYVASGPTMIAAVLLTMRLIAEERQTGTFTLLNTSPVAAHEIVLGKFLSVLIVLTLMTVLTSYMPALIFVNGKVSLGHIAVGYLGLFLLGSASAAIGLFASALGSSPIVGGIIAAAIHGVLILLWAVAKAADPPLNSLLAALALHNENQQAFMVGLLELHRVAYYVCVSAFFLLAASKLVEARRWR